MMNGQRTLRDLALKANKQLLAITKSFMPYVHQGLIKLSDVEDLRPVQSAVLLLSQATSVLPVNSPQPQSSVPLIAHIDDSQEEGRRMNQILTQLGYGYLHIQNPIQALPLLLDQKPNLIFLDLVMPVVNGYEACAQIRRIARFKDIPIIILTSSDGIVDRVRAKIVGSTDFLAKPVKPEKVQAILQKYRV
jgi:chemotaxis family two-component system response regulator PixG